MPFGLAGDVAGNAMRSPSSPAAPARPALVADQLGDLLPAPPPAPLALARERGVYLEDDPTFPGYQRYAVVGRDGRVIAWGCIERDDADTRLRVLFAAFLDRRDPLPRLALMP